MNLLKENILQKFKEKRNIKLKNLNIQEKIYFQKLILLNLIFGKINNLSPIIYNKFQSDINHIKNSIKDSNEIEIERIESILFNTLKPIFSSLFNENNIKDLMKIILKIL